MSQLYREYSSYLREKYGEKVYKLPIKLPLTCPNRIGERGCTFCSEVGTGFEGASSDVNITSQLAFTREKIEKKYHAKKFIAYFQNFTNTFLPLEQFKKYVEEAAKFDDIVEISISTRPDCIKKEYLQFLKEIEKTYGIAITIELGLQTVNYRTLEKINRGHSLAEFIDAVLAISSCQFSICVHMILNLPWDTMEDAIESAKILSALPISIVKLHSLYIPKKTVLYEQYENGTITLCSKEEYINRVIKFLTLLRPDIVVERLFSRVPKEYAVFSNWDTSWWKLKEQLEQTMRENNLYQGKDFHYLYGAALAKLEKLEGDRDAKER